MKNLIIVSVVALSFVSCVRKESVVVPNEPVQFGLSALPYYPGEAPRQLAEESVFDMESIDLAVHFDWSNQWLIGDAMLTLSPRFYPQDSVVLDARGFELKEVSMEGSDLRFRYDSLKLVVYLPEVLTREDSCALRIKYIAKPNELPNGGGRAITEDKGLYFINPLGKEDKPQQIWTQGEPEANSCWVPVIDAPNQKVKQVIRITVGDSLKTLSNGVLESQELNGDGTRTDTWRQEMKHAPYLMMIAVGDFEIVKDENVGPIEVSYYVEPAFKAHARAVFGNTPEMISFFSERLGVPYPWGKYSQVVVRDFVSGAMENTSASVFMEQLQISTRETLDKNWDFIIAHELFHHWFGDYVTCESWSNLALNESFANYSEYLWMDHKYGREVAEFHRVEELQGYLGESRRKRVPIIRYNYHQPDDMFDAHSYNKGGLVLHMLRRYLGDEAFFLGLKNYLEANANQATEIHHLRHSFEKISGKDLTWFFDKWFLSPGHPELEFNKKWNGDTLELTVHQVQDSIYSPVFEFPLEIGLYGEGQSSMTVWVDSRHKVVKIPHLDSSTVVLPNSDGVVPMDMLFEFNLEEVRTLSNSNLPFFTRYQFAQGVASYLEEVDVVYSIEQSKRNEKAAAFLTKFELNRQSLFEASLKLAEDRSPDIRSIGFKSLGIFSSHEDVIKRAMMVIEFDNSTKVRSEAIKCLSKLDSTGLVYRDVYVSGVKDSSFLVVAAALEPFLRVETGSSKALIEELEESQNQKIVKCLMSYYKDKKDTLKIEWAWSKYLQLSPIGKIRVSQELSELLLVLSQKNRSAFVQKLRVRGIEEKHLYDRFSAYKVLFFLESGDEVEEARRDVIRNEKNPTLIGAYKRWEKKRE